MVPKQTILNKAENQVRQQLFGGILLAVAGLMIMTTLGWVNAAATNTNMTFNITSGAFTIVNAPESMAFASQSFGTPANILGNEEVDGLTIRDYRGNAQPWTVAMSANNFDAGGNIINANRLNGYASNGAITNVENGDTNRTAKGSSGFLNNTGITLLNGSTQASGVFRYDNGVVRLTVDGTEIVGTYGAILTYTLT